MKLSSPSMARRRSAWLRPRRNVLVLSGQTVCRINRIVTVDKIEIGDTRERDSRDRALPIWSCCSAIAKGEVSVMNQQSAHLPDGRYFGPLPAASFIGRAIPLWTDQTETKERSCCHRANLPLFGCLARALAFLGSSPVPRRRPAQCVPVSNVAPAPRRFREEHRARVGTFAVCQCGNPCRGDFRTLSSDDQRFGARQDSVDCALCNTALRPSLHGPHRGRLKIQHSRELDSRGDAR